jgi:uncharacterized membrane protein
MQVLKKIKKNFVKGLYITLPVTLTFYIFSLAINFVSFHLQFIHHFLKIPIIKNIPYSEIVIFILIIIIIGKISNFFIVDKIINFTEEQTIKKIPIVSLIYNGMKQIIKTLKISETEKKENQAVAWVKIPHQGFFALGLYAGKLETQYQPKKEKTYHSFFLPSTPNPVTGHYIIAEEGEFIFISMTKEEAISMIISGGIIRPPKKNQDT